MPLDKIKSQRNADQIVHKNGIFRFERTNSGGTTYWKCIEYDRQSCRCRIHTEGSSYNRRVIKEVGQHNHIPNKTEVDVRKFKNKVKEVAKTTQVIPHQIVAAECVGLSDHARALLPSVNQIKRNIRNYRKTNDVPNASPVNRTELIIPFQYTQITEGNNNIPFLLFDSGPSEDRILIFSTWRNLQLMSNSQHWFADGTFKTTPSLFDQLYTIHGIKYNNVIPLVFILMPNRDEQTYLRVFNELSILQPNLNPASIMTDFERAAINAFHTTFPNATQRGCFFHFTQCVWRRIQDCGLSGRYINDEEFAHQIKMLTSLSFVPEADVIRTFEQLIFTDFFMENQDEIADFIDYIEDNWIGRQRGATRRPPRFALSLWNCYSGVLDGLPKTNNSVEGWHKEFSSLIAATHPTIWKFIDELKKQQSINDIKITQYLAGQNPELGGRRYRNLAERISNIVRENHQRGPIDYLSSLAHNLSLNR